MGNDNYTSDGSSTGVSALQNAVRALNGILYTLNNIYTFMQGESLVSGAMSLTISTLFTVRAKLKYTIEDIEISNTDATSQTFSLYFVPPGSIAEASNAIFYNASIPANGYMQWRGKQVLPEGYTIQAQSSSIKLTIFINGAKGIPLLIQGAQ